MAMTLRLTDEQDSVLSRLAEAEGVSKHEAVLRAITDAASRRLHEERVDQFAGEGRERYAALLARLAE